MNTFVLCPDVALDWCIQNHRDNHYALGILERLRESSAVVPAVWAHEIADLLLQKEQERLFTSADTRRFLELLGRLPITMQVERPERTLEDVLALAREAGLSMSAAAYLDLAVRKGLPLATQREDLCRAAKALGRSIA